MKYKCQVCGREIDDYVSIAHIKAEEYLIDLIRRDHTTHNSPPQLNLLSKNIS